MNRDQREFNTFAVNHGIKQILAWVNELRERANPSATLDSLPEGIKGRVNGVLPEESNVINAVFGTSQKKPGRQATRNGPLNLLSDFMRQNPKGTCAQFRAYALGINPSLNVSSLTSTFYKYRAVAA